MKQYSLARGANIAYKTDQAQQPNDPESQIQNNTEPTAMTTGASEARTSKSQSSVKMKTIIMPSGEILRAKVST